MAPPRLFLVAPDLPVDRLLACLAAACEAGDVASLLVAPGTAAAVVELAQARGVAVLATGGPVGSLDGLHIDAASQSVAETRKAVGSKHIVGAYAGSSRHLAMEAADQGADYVALSQNGPTLGGEPIV